MHFTGTPRTIPMPHLPSMARRIAFQVGEAVIIPLGLFYVVMMLANLHWALIVALAWAYFAIGVRVVRGGRPPMMLVVATALATLRVGITAAADSAVTYFLQPTITTYLTGFAILATVAFKRPLLQRFADDFCPLPSDVVHSPHIRRLFQRLSLLWAGVLVANASMTLGMLLTMPTSLSVPIAGVGSAPLFVLGLFASWRWFQKSLHASGFVLKWGSPAPHSA